MKKHKKSKNKDRLIFSYWNGEKMVHGDPIDIQLGLVNAPDIDFEGDIKTLVTATPEAPRAMTRITDAVRVAFKIKPFDQGGLLKSECLTLLISFCKFVDDLKKKVECSPISWKPTVSVPGNSLMQTSVVSGSTQTELSSVDQLQLPSVSQQPLVENSLPNGMKP